jgi:hypothetical protein
MTSFVSGGKQWVLSCDRVQAGTDRYLAGCWLRAYSETIRRGVNQLVTAMAGVLRW